MNLREGFERETGYDSERYRENYIEWLENKLDSKDDFEKAVEPAIRYLLKNYNPHTSIYIRYDVAELLFGQKCHNLSNEVPD